MPACPAVRKHGWASQPWHPLASAAASQDDRHDENDDARHARNDRYHAGPRLRREDGHHSPRHRGAGLRSCKPAGSGNVGGTGPADLVLVGSQTAGRRNPGDALRTALRGRAIGPHRRSTATAWSHGGHRSRATAPPVAWRHDGDPFAWYLDAWSAEIAAAVCELAARLAEYPRELVAAIPGGGHDLFKPLYQAVFPRRLRHALGEYYTPDWLAEHVLDQVGYQGDGRPAAGSGLRFRHVSDGGHAAAAGRSSGDCHAGTSSARRDSRPRRRPGPQSAGGHDRPGELPAGHRRPAARRRRGRDARLSLRRDPGGPRVGRAERQSLRFRRRQSALDRLGQPARTRTARRPSRCGSGTGCSRFRPARPGTAAARRTSPC